MPRNELENVTGHNGLVRDADTLTLVTEWCVHCMALKAWAGIRSGHVLTARGTQITAAFCSEECYHALTNRFVSAYYGNIQGCWGPWRVEMGLMAESYKYNINGTLCGQRTHELKIQVMNPPSPPPPLRLLDVD